METENLNFGQALQALDEGEMLQRQGWNGKGMFVFMNWQKPIKKEYISQIDVYSSMVKEYLKQKDKDIVLLPHLCMYTATGEILHGWLASQTDMLANDWRIVEIVDGKYTV